MPNQHVIFTQPEVSHEFDPFQGFDVGMHIADADIQFVQVFGEVFRHALGQGGDQNAVAGADLFPDFADEVIHLEVGGAHFDSRDPPVRSGE